MRPFHQFLGDNGNIFPLDRSLLFTNANSQLAISIRQKARNFWPLGMFSQTEWGTLFWYFPTSQPAIEMVPSRSRHESNFNTILPLQFFYFYNCFSNGV